MSLSEQEIKELVTALEAELTKSNPGFVRRDLCDERHSWLQRAIYGIYGLLGVIAVSLLLEALKK